MTNDAMSSLVRSAYEPVVARQLQSIADWNRRFPRTPEDEQRRRRLRRAENDRRVSLMRDHQPEPGTTDVCRCGFVCYSTPGYLLHLYEVIAADATGDDG